MVIAVLAVVFAPGMLRDAEDRSPEAVSAAVLAPTTDHGDSAVSGSARETGWLVELIACACAVVMVVAPRRTRRPTRTRRIRSVATDVGSPLIERGPPTLAA